MYSSKFCIVLFFFCTRIARIALTDTFCVSENTTAFFLSISSQILSMSHQVHQSHITGPVSITLTQYLLQTQPPGVKGDFSILMMAIQTAVKVIEQAVRRAGHTGHFGQAVAKGTNATGDDQAKLDVLSNEVFKFNLVTSEKIFVLGSEEEDFGVLVEEKKRGCYLICFDPLDGSSNIDCNVSVGSIWGIWRVNPSDFECKTDEDVTKVLLRKGNTLVSSGYAMYGSATNLVLTTGHGVNGFMMDAHIGEFVLTHPNMKIGKKRIYSVNEGNGQRWEPWFQEYIAYVKSLQKPYSLRYIGSMVADVHRTILYGGVFCYPNDSKSPNGKLRYLYEAAPMAFLVEQAGGAATTGTMRILDVMPEKLHQRVPVFLGSKPEIELLLSFRNKNPPKSKL